MKGKRRKDLPACEKRTNKTFLFVFGRRKIKKGKSILRDLF